MPDVLAIALLLAFFALAIVFVHACERIIGPDLEAESSGMTQPVAAPEQPAA
jgi:hypothetical protein